MSTPIIIQTEITCTPLPQINNSDAHAHNLKYMYSFNSTTTAMGLAKKTLYLHYRKFYPIKMTPFSPEFRS